MEEEGEGFCDQQKWNQEIGPKILNSHPRLLSCPECTLLPKVMTFLFCFFGTGSLVFNQQSDAGGNPVSYVDTQSLHSITRLVLVEKWALPWKCRSELVLHFLYQFPSVVRFISEEK